IAVQLSALPEALSYSPIILPTREVGQTRGGRVHTLARRDLFDARFQLLAQGRDEQATFVDAPADLVPGVYEGGLKTWECSLDLAAYLDRDVLGSRRGVRGLRVLELGCGTAVPTLLLLDRLFAFLASSEVTADPSDRGEASPTSPVSVTEIHLQDYNHSVLELVTLPNVLLTWFPSATRGQERGCGRPGGLTVTEELLSAFTTSLEAHNIRLRFFSGSWTSLSKLFAHQLQGAEQARPLYDVILASETIYRAESLEAFLGVVQGGVGRKVMRETTFPIPLCLVAAKVLYFGVGGGVQGFVRAVEDEHGTVRTVWEHREGVMRKIMQVEW
ncbi:hypothetical protein B0F90DRAFT_1627125, partial [Multifurca ochricompacta]